MEHYLGAMLASSFLPAGRCIVSPQLNSPASVSTLSFVLGLASMFVSSRSKVME